MTKFAKFKVNNIIFVHLGLGNAEVAIRLGKVDAVIAVQLPIDLVIKEWSDRDIYRLASFNNVCFFYRMGWSVIFFSALN